MSGSATFTIVMSSSSMNTPVQTAMSVHHFGSRPAGCGGAAACRLMDPPLAEIITELTITCGTIRSDP